MFSNCGILQLHFFRCEDFVYFCDVHHTFSMGPRCCGTLFNPDPVFTHSGVCYTIKTDIVEYLASSYSSIRFYFTIDNANSFSE